MKCKIILSLLSGVILVTGTGLILARYAENERIEQKKERLTQEKRLLNNILYSVENCVAPCWQDILPGQSKEVEYQSISEKLSQEGLTFRHKSSEDNYTVYSWFDPKDAVYLYIHITSEGIIDRITFSKIDLISVENLFYFLGQPDYYASEYIWDIETIITLDLVYVEEGIVIMFEGIRPGPDTSDCYLDLSKLRVREINLVSPSEPQKMLADSLLDYPRNLIKPWAGSDAVRIQKCFPER